MSDKDAKARERVIKRMKWVDSLPADLRACVHEHGITIVQQFLNCGVTKAKHINHIINTIREGSKEVGKRTNASPIADGRAPAFYWHIGTDR